MITFKCVSCGATLRVAKEKGGKQGKCPRCSLMVRVPHSQMEADDAEYLLAQRQDHAQQRLAAGGEPPAEQAGGPPPSQPVGTDSDVIEVYPGAESPQAAPAPAPGAGENAPVGTETVSVASRASSAPPMSWPTEASQTPRAPGAAPHPAPTAPPAPAPPAPPAAAQAPTTPASTASVRGSHGLLALLVVLLVAVATVGWVGWRNWEHTWNFSTVITLCRPAMTFQARPREPESGSLRGKVLVCNELGGPSPVTSTGNGDLVATSVNEVKAVIFVRRNDQTSQARAFRRSGRILAAAPVGYEICAVDVDTRQVLWTATVGAEDEGRAAEALYGLIRRCTRPAGP